MKKRIRNILLLMVNIFVIVYLIVSFISFRNNRYSHSWKNEGYFATHGYYDTNLSGYIIDESSNYQGIFTCGPYTHIDKGIYNVTVFYETDTDLNTCVSRDDNLRYYYNGLQSDTVVLPKGGTSVSFKVRLNHDAEYFEVQTFYGGKGSLVIKEVVVEKSLQTITVKATTLLFLLFVLDMFVLCLYAKIKKCDKTSRMVLMSLFATIVLASAPIFESGFETILGDGRFHLLRIDGIADSLRKGIFPVKIQPNWINDYGYAVSVFYGDAFLYFPAVLRILGFSVEVAYKCFVFTLAVMSVLISYFSYKKIFSDRKIGLFACVLYSLSGTYLEMLHGTNAIGQYIAMIFFPLLLSGVLGIIRSDKECPKEKMSLSLQIIISATAIINAHVPSVKITIVVMLVVLLLFLKSFSKAKLLQFLIIAAVILALNSGYLVPFFDYYMNEGVIAANPEAYQLNYIQRWGTPLFSYIINLYKPLCISGLQLIILPIFIGVLFYYREEIVQNKKMEKWICIGKRFVIVIVFLLLLCLDIFPWDILADILGKHAHIVNEMQFPIRWGYWSSALLCLLAGIIVKVFHEFFSKQKINFALIVCAVVYALSTQSYYNAMFPEKVDADERYHFYDTAVLPTDNLYGGQYLPEGTDWSQYVHNKVMASETVELVDYQKDGLQVEFTCINHADDGYIELPLTYYTGYKAIDAVTKEELKVAKGNNNVVSVQIPENYMGNVKVFFSAPMAWNISYVISFITAIGIVVVMIVNRKKERKNRIMEKQVTSC